MIVVVDEIGQIVEQTQQKLGNPLFYSHGHVKEISSMLAQYGMTAEHSKLKYPRIMLLQDFVEHRGINAEIDTEATLQLLIVANSNPQYRAEDRLSKVFKPTLYPIYEEFIYQLYRSRKFSFRSIDSISHDKIDRLAMSAALNEAVRAQGDKNLFNDHLDGIEVRNLRLPFKKTC